MRKIIHSMLRLFGGLFMLLITYMPGDIGYALRKRYWRRRLGKLGDGARIETGVFFERPELIFIDDQVRIDQGATFLAGKAVAGGRRIIRGKSTVEEGHLYIGKNVHVNAYATLSGIGGLRIGNNTQIAAKARYLFLHPRDPRAEMFFTSPASHRGQRHNWNERLGDLRWKDSRWICDQAELFSQWSPEPQAIERTIKTWKKRVVKIDVTYADMLVQNLAFRTRTTGSEYRVAVLSNITVEPLGDFLEYVLMSLGAHK